MSSQPFALDIATALTFIGQTVLVEQKWEQEPESYWHCVHIIGVVLPVPGVCSDAYFMVVNVAHEKPFHSEMFFADIRTIRAIRHRDRQSSGNVLGRMSRPIPMRSGAALPARRNSSIVPSNGSTGAAHP